jgi:hypothetical protein
MPPQAITTYYNGCRFRSRLEARWAIFFDAANIGWEYEPEGYQLTNNNYLADFKLTSFGRLKVDVFVEVKPEKPDTETLRKCFELAIITHTDLIIICGSPGHPEFKKLEEDWLLAKGYVLISIPGKMFKGDKELATWDFEHWNATNRLSLFQTDVNGNFFDIWPLYFLLEPVKENLIHFKTISKVKDTIFELHSLNINGYFIISHYVSPQSPSTGRITDHPRLMYAYQIARSARFEHDEFNIRILQGFYDALDTLPFDKPYVVDIDSWALYYDANKRSFIARVTKEIVSDSNVLLVKACPKLIIKQFIAVFGKQRPTDPVEVIEAWEGFLFRYSVRLQDGRLIRTFFDQ